MNDARRYAVWPEPRSRSLKGSRPSVPHGTNFYFSLFGKYSAHPLGPRIQRRTQGRVSPGEGSMGPGMLFFQEAYEVPPLTLCALRRRVVREHYRPTSRRLDYIYGCFRLSQKRVGLLVNSRLRLRAVLI